MTDIFKYPFIADVWGTVSDWVMIAVTGLTAYFLYKTLRSQTKIQKMQQKITDIEDFKFKSSLMPKFVVKGNTPHYPSNTNEAIKADYWLELSNENQAKNIKISGVLSDATQVVEKEWRESSLSVKDRLHIAHHFKTDNVAVCSFFYKLNVYYEDIAGHGYHQYLEVLKPHRDKKSTGIKTEPALISNTTVV